MSRRPIDPKAETGFIIRDLIFEVFDQATKRGQFPEFALKVTFVDGASIWISHEYGRCETVGGCCYQAMVWMEKTGI